MWSKLIIVDVNEKRLRKFIPDAWVADYLNFRNGQSPDFGLSLVFIKLNQAQLLFRACNPYDFVLHCLVTR